MDCGAEGPVTGKALEVVPEQCLAGTFDTA